MSAVLHTDPLILDCGVCRRDSALLCWEGDDLTVAVEQRGRTSTIRVGPLGQIELSGWLQRGRTGDPSLPTPMQHLLDALERRERIAWRWAYAGMVGMVVACGLLVTVLGMGL